MRVQRRAALLMLAAVLAAGCGSEASQGPAAVEPKRWTPWVLSGAELASLPIDPAAVAAAEDALAGARPAAGRRDPGEAVGRWIEAALVNVAEHTKNPPAASRAYALVSVAMHDAVLAAERAGDRGQAVAVEAAVAGAASRVLADLYRENARHRLDEEAEAAALAAGPRSRHAAAAGLVAGRAVAERVIAAAAGDRPDRRWTGRPPRGRGLWRPPPGSVARPVAPLAANWRTWVLPAPDAVRPPPPPRYGSRRFLADAREVLDVSRRLTPQQTAVASVWAGGEGTALPPGIWNQVALQAVRDRRLPTAAAARVFAALNVAMADAGVAIWDAKYAYWSPRPVNAILDLGLAREWEPEVPTPIFPSYPSGHAGYSGAAAEVLSHLFADQAPLFRAKAREAAASRLYGGIHYRTDNETGLRMGRAIARRVIARLRSEARE